MSRPKKFNVGQVVEFRRHKSREWVGGTYCRRAMLMCADVMHDVIPADDGVVQTVPSRRIRAKESKRG